MLERLRNHLVDIQFFDTFAFMRICIFNWRDEANPAAGGAEVYTHEIMAHWVRLGHEVTLVAAGFDGADPVEERTDGVRVERVGNRFTVYGEARRWWERSGRTRGFDVLVDEVNTRPFLCKDWNTGVPVVVFAHQVCREVWWYQAPLPVAAAGRFVFEPWWLSRLAGQSVITVSDSSRVSLERYGLADVRVVPEGGELTPRPDVEREQRPTAVFIGRLVGAKRPSHAIRAFQHARLHVPDAQLWVMGGGPKLERLRRRAGDGVEMLGRVSMQERTERMARAHVLVVTSVREGWGLVVSEAAAVGTPAIGYDVPGLRDSITASGGHLAPADPVLLGEALAEVLSNPIRPPFSTGVESWDVVAEKFLVELCDAAGLPAPTLALV